MPTTTASVAELKKAIQLAEQIQKLEAELQAILGRVGGKAAPATTVARQTEKPARKKGTMSAAGRARIVAAQKARWAKIKAAKSSAAPVSAKAAAPAKAKAKKKRGLTAEGRAKLAAMMKARWAARKKGAPALNAPKKKA